MTPADLARWCVPDGPEIRLVLPGEVAALRERIAAAVTEAVMAERDRCARLVENYRGTDEQREDGTAPDLGHWQGEWYVLDADKVAAAIRTPPPAPG